MTKLEREREKRNIFARFVTQRSNEAAEQRRRNAISRLCRSTLDLQGNGARHITATN